MQEKWGKLHELGFPRLLHNVFSAKDTASILDMEAGKIKNILFLIFPASISRMLAVSLAENTLCNSLGNPSSCNLPHFSCIYISSLGTIFSSIPIILLYISLTIFVWLR